MEKIKQGPKEGPKEGSIKNENEKKNLYGEVGAVEGWGGLSFKDLLESPVPKKEKEEEGNAANQSTTAKDILYHNHTNDMMRFEPINGGFEDIRVSSQTSYSNAAEAEVLVNVIKKFLNEGNITLSQIGVISPYKAQVRHLADRFRSEGWLEQHAPRSIEVFEGKFSKNKKSKMGDGKGHLLQL